MDGGGVRGLLILQCLERLEQQTGRRVHEMFDLICGTSTGGFLAMLLGIQRLDIAAVRERYNTITSTLGSQNYYYSEVKRVVTGTSHDESLYERLLTTWFGKERLSETASSPKVFVVSAAVNSYPSQVYLFRNYELVPAAKREAEFLGTSNVLLAEAVRATTSAPTYYNPAKVGGQSFVDGAILANNPTCIALSEAATLWPGATIDCLLSIGTGTQNPRPYSATGITTWVKAMVDLAMSSHVTHAIASSILGPCYYRLDADGLGDIDLIESRPEVLDKMLDDGRRYIERQGPLFDRLAALLTSKRTWSEGAMGHAPGRPVGTKGPAAPGPAAPEPAPGAAAGGGGRREAEGEDGPERGGAGSIGDRGRSMSEGRRLTHPWTGAAESGTSHPLR